MFAIGNGIPLRLRNARLPDDVWESPIALINLTLYIDHMLARPMLAL